MSLVQMIQHIMTYSLMGNSFLNYFIVGALSVVWHLSFNITERKLQKILSQFGFSYGIIEAFRKGALPIIHLGGFYLILNHLKLAPTLTVWLAKAWMIFFTIQVARMVQAISFSIFQNMWKRHHKNNETMLKLTISKILQVVIWLLTVIFILDNLGFNISAAVAGLGIGGVAVALASKNILGDLFNYFVIFFDRPFEVGDTIHVNELVGTIEHIGLKTTRLRAVSGEQIIISNTDLASSRIRNYKSMRERRVLFTLNISYNNEYEKIEKIVPLVKALITEHSQARYDRGHLKSLSDSSLVYEFVYYVLGADYHVYMSIQESVNLGIKKLFEQNAIQFLANQPTSADQSPAKKIP